MATVTTGTALVIIPNFRGFLNKNLDNLGLTTTQEGKFITADGWEFQPDGHYHYSNTIDTHLRVYGTFPQGEVPAQVQSIVDEYEKAVQKLNSELTVNGHYQSVVK